MRRIFTSLIFLVPMIIMAQTPIPNNSFENWTNFGSYENPTGWDSPNYEISSIPFFGTTVVTKSTDHQGAGNYSVRMESKHITLPPLDIPGFISNGNLTLDIVNMTYTMTGGEPVFDQPTHLKGYFKFLPKGGDSCLIAIGLFKRNGLVRDTIAGGFFSTKDTIPDWTPFSAWIDYDSVVQPDSMNIFAFSTAQQVVTPGTVLFLDNLYLDYTVGVNKLDPKTGISVYNDRETSRLLVFFDFPEPQPVSLCLFNMMGQQVAALPSSRIQNERRIIGYEKLPKGVYILEILHSGQKYCEKYFLKN